MYGQILSGLALGICIIGMVWLAGLLIYGLARAADAVMFEICKERTIKAPPLLAFRIAGVEG
jgi:hypothetical protein